MTRELIVSRATCPDLQNYSLTIPKYQKCTTLIFKFSLLPAHPLYNASFFFVFCYASVQYLSFVHREDDHQRIREKTQSQHLRWPRIEELDSPENAAKRN
ncbi:hypothetical protein evm_010755 [Chilo suppressalis]|nr:hypothetical protein evm_010755 [Chilo suppressalis]